MLDFKLNYVSKSGPWCLNPFMIWSLILIDKWVSLHTRTGLFLVGKMPAYLNYTFSITCFEILFQKDHVKSVTLSNYSIHVCACVNWKMNYMMTEYHRSNVSYHIILYHIISYHIIPYHTIPYHIIYHITSHTHHITSHHIISYHIISYHIISYHIISYHMFGADPHFWLAYNR